MGMRILDIQKRAREIGRIRLGEKAAKGNPVRLDTFRFTTQDEEAINYVANTYGGTVKPWQDGYEVVTEAKSLNIAIPAGIDPISQSYELWSAGGCQRRCDGQTEYIGGGPCVCNPEARECKPTLRVNLLLPDIPVVGLWRLETHGYYANSEIPPLVDMLQSMSGHTRGILRLEPREVKRDGKTRKFTVPVLDVHVSMDALIDGGERPALPKPTKPELPAGPEPRALPSRGSTPVDVGDVLDQFEAVELATDDELKGMFDAARERGITDAALKARVKKLRGVESTQGMTREEWKKLMEGIG